MMTGAVGHAFFGSHPGVVAALLRHRRAQAGASGERREHDNNFQPRH